MKQIYNKPALNIIKLNLDNCILAASPNILGNGNSDDIILHSRRRTNDIYWDDEEEEDL